MSVRSWFVHDEQEMSREIRRETVSEADDRETLVRRSSRLKIPNKRRDLEEDFAEKANALFRSRAGHISTLTRIQGDIETIMCACEEASEVMSRKAKYDDAWRKFVNAHEQYIEYINSKEEKEKALLSYERQKIRKLYFDEEVQLWCKNLELEAKGNTEEVLSYDKKQMGTIKYSETASRTGKSSNLSRKEEKLAIAKLRVTQLRKQQQLERKMTELKFEKEMMEAQMEEELAAVSLIYEPDNEEEQNLDYAKQDRYKDVHDGRDSLHLIDGAINRSGLNAVNHIPSEVNSDTIKKVEEINKSTLFLNPSQTQGIAKYYVEPNSDTIGSFNQPTLRHHKQKLQKRNQGTTLRKMNPSPVKAPTNDDWSQDVQVTTETDIKQLRPTFQTLGDLAGNRKVTNQSIGQFIEQSQPPQKMTSTSWPQMSQSPERTTTTFWPQKPQLPPRITTPFFSHASQLPQRRIDHDVETLPAMINTGEEVVRALRQVVSTPKIEYMHFDGDPVNYISFMHNFETCLEKDNPENSRRLQLLIQHCTGKAREAVESCVNLPEEHGYWIAKETLRENFGKPHIIARAHIRKLENLAPLKQANGQSLLEFVRYLEVVNRTLAGMGSEYTEELDHVNTLKSLNRKLPGFMRVKWTERAGEIIEHGLRPKFAHFLQFVKRRAMLVNNEFGEDLTNPLSDKSGKPKNRDFQGRFSQRSTSFMARDSGDKKERDNLPTTRGKCPMCSGEHRIWRCDKFRRLPYQEKKKLVQARVLCFKCLCNGHLAKQCQKTYFKCQIQGCNKEHNTLLHPTGTRPLDQGEVRTKNQVSRSTNTDFEPEEATIQQERAKVTSAIGVGEKVCLSVIPVKVKVMGGDGPTVKTYALLDSGSEVTLCHERLKRKLGASGAELDFTLSGITGATRMKSELIDITVTSMDNVTSVNLSNVRTVTEIPISGSCIAREEDVRSWSHLKDIDLHELNVDDVMLVIGLQEKPSLFVPVEYRIGGENEPIGVRYSLGWTVIGPVGGRKDKEVCSTNFVRTLNNSCITKENDEFQYQFPFSKFDENVNAKDRQTVNPLNESSSDLIAEQDIGNQQHLYLWETEVERQRQNDDLNQQLEGLWKTDFEGSLLDNKTCDSIEDRRALRVMETTLTKVNGHFQVALPWRYSPPSLPNNKVVASRRAFLLKKRLMKDESLRIKYRETMNNYIGDGHAEKVPEEELNPDDRPVWFVPHHPVVHPLKPEKVRVVYDCAATYKGTSLNQQLMSGPDQTNQLLGVLIRFRQENIGLVADVEAMFHQVLVEPKDRDVLRFLWWPNADLSKELQEYRMVKHLFGATSSPSVANFCLRKTAELNSEEFDDVTIKTVKRNMYVDDLLKSTDTTDKAIRLVQQLRELLQRGGFRLTK